MRYNLSLGKMQTFGDALTLFNCNHFSLFLPRIESNEWAHFYEWKIKKNKDFRPANDFASLKYPSIYCSLNISLDTDWMLKMARVQFCIESGHLNHSILKLHQVPFQRNTRHSCTFRALVSRCTPCFIRLIETHQISHSICTTGFGGILELN